MATEKMQSVVEISNNSHQFDPVAASSANARSIDSPRSTTADETN